MIQEAISSLLEGKDLTEEETAESFAEIMSGRSSEAQTAAFLMGLAIKGETANEIKECARIMREVSTPVEHEGDVLEIVGTGGDRVGTFNISTASAIVTAAAGVPTAKHGNRSVSSKSGAADVLESLGVTIDLNQEQNAKVLADTNLCFMFAPVYHSSMKYAAPVRKDLGIPTIFNILGPLANPARATIQLLGVYSEDLVLPMAEALVGLGIKSGMVVCGEDGLDEITTTGPTLAALIQDGTIEQIVIHPEDYGIELTELENLIGGDSDKNAELIKEVFSGNGGPLEDIVVLNSSVALYLAGKVENIEEGVELAREIIKSGKAREKLEEFVAATQNV